MTRARTFLSCLKRIARRREDDHRCNISPMGMLFEYWMLLTQGMLSVESSVGKHLKKNSMATKGLDPQVKPNWHLFICSVWRTRFFFLCWCLCDDLNASTWRFSGTGHFHAPVDTSLHRFLLWNLFENLYQIFFVDIFVVAVVGWEIGYYRHWFWIIKFPWRTEFHARSRLISPRVAQLILKCVGRSSTCFHRLEGMRVCENSDQIPIWLKDTKKIR